MTDVALDPRVERTRAGALDAAMAVAIAEGWDAVNQHRVAEAANLGRATVYRHWPDRMELLRDAIRHASSRITTALETTGDVRRDLETALTLLAIGLDQFHLGTVLSGLMDRAERDPAINAIKLDVLHESLVPFRRVFEVAVDAGELRADVDVDRECATLIGPVLYRRLLTGEPLTPAFLSAVVDDFLAVNAP